MGAGEPPEARVGAGATPEAAPEFIVERERRKEERQKKTPDVVRTTWFRARGFVGEARTPGPIDMLPGHISGPNRFFSNEGEVLGRVVWDGHRSVGQMLGLLNAALNIRGRDGRLRDFRTVYDRWDYRWELKEMPRGGKTVTVDTFDDGI